MGQPHIMIKLVFFILAILKPTVGTHVTAMSAHKSNCALLDDSEMKCFGYNQGGRLGLGDEVARGDGSGEMGDNLPVVPLGTGLSVTSMSGGYNYNCALLDNSQMKCFGNNYEGVLGMGDNGDYRGGGSGEMGDNLPVVPLGTSLTVTSMSMSYFHTCALLDNSEMKCFGNNDDGFLGMGDQDKRGDGSGEMGDNLPAVPLGTSLTVTSMSVGYFYTCALLDNSQMKCFGTNYPGQLGMGDKVYRGGGSGEMGDNLPVVPLGTSLTVTSMVVGYSHTCALLDNSQMKCFGENYCELGMGDSGIYRGDGSGEMGDNLAAVPLGTSLTVTSMVAYKHTCVLLDNSEMKCFGRNEGGKLGMGDKAHRGDGSGEMGDNLPVVPLGTSLTVTSMSVGVYHTCALLDNSEMKCFGKNTYGQLGMGDLGNRGEMSGEMGDNLSVIPLGTTNSPTSAPSTTPTSAPSTTPSTTPTSNEESPTSNEESYNAASSNFSVHTVSILSIVIFSIYTWI